MSGPDDEFDDFLSRRKPLFRRPSEDPFEPPEDLDRIVLRRARDAIESDRPQRVFQGPRWGAPLAIAATLLVAFAVVLHSALPKKGPTPEVSVQAVSQPVDEPAVAAAAPAPPPPPAAAPGWRSDSKAWLARIEQLRAAGKTAEADAEAAEYQRQHRAYAGAPDR